MTPEQLLTHAKALHAERQERCFVYGWNGSGERQEFLRRCRNLAKQIDVNATYPDPEAAAQMILDSIATREGVEFYFKGEEATPVHAEYDASGRNKPHKQSLGRLRRSKKN